MCLEPAVFLQRVKKQTQLSEHWKSPTDNLSTNISHWCCIFWPKGFFSLVFPSVGSGSSEGGSSCSWGSEGNGAVPGTGQCQELGSASTILASNLLQKTFPTAPDQALTVPHSQGALALGLLLLLWFYLLCCTSIFLWEMHHFKLTPWRFFSASWFNWRLIIKHKERERGNSYTGKSTINIFLGSWTQPCITSPSAVERIRQHFHEISKRCLQFNPKLTWLFL